MANVRDASSPTVLLVEDDDAVREAVAEVMAEEGLRVVEASNGRAAIELLQHGDAPAPCCIVLDLMMPVMDGFEFCQWLDRQPDPLRRIPVVLLSASPRLREAAQDLRASGHLAKPISVETLLRTLSPYCGRVVQPSANEFGADPDLRAA